MRHEINISFFNLPCKIWKVNIELKTETLKKIKNVINDVINMRKNIN